MQLVWDHAVALLITLITCTMQNCVVFCRSVTLLQN